MRAYKVKFPQKNILNLKKNRHLNLSIIKWVDNASHPSVQTTNVCLFHKIANKNFGFNDL